MYCARKDMSHDRGNFRNNPAFITSRLTSYPSAIVRRDHMQSAHDPRRNQPPIATASGEAPSILIGPSSFRPLLRESPNLGQDPKPQEIDCPLLR